MAAPPLRIPDVLTQAAAEQPEAEALLYGEQRISYGALDETSDRIASALLALGVRRGDRIGVILETQPEWIELFFAAAKIGAIIVGLNVRYRETELSYMLRQSGARLVVTLARHGDMDYVAFFRDLRAELPSAPSFAFVEGEGFDGSASFEAWRRAPIDRAALDAARAAVEPLDPSMIIYTSGTTGTPKGALLTHRSQLTSGMVQAAHTGVRQGDRMLLAVPLNHVGGVDCAVMTMFVRRATCVLVRAFSPAAAIRACRDHRVTKVGGVPTMLTLMMQHPDFAGWDRGAVRLVVVGGANADPPLIEAMRRAFPASDIMNLYGLSEASGGVVMPPPGTAAADPERLARSIGKPLRGYELCVRGPGGEPRATGEVGEICIRGDCLARGYFDMPEATAATFDAEGWLRTGDLGYVDGDGFVFLAGRRSDMYIQGGFNVYPIEVENLLATHPAVLMVAGIGVPDPVLGEVGRYYVVVRPGMTTTEAELMALARARLADYKVPKRVVFRDALPLTPLGKIHKAELIRAFLLTGE